ncbi:interferon regulatory factor 8 isoform X2 [Rhinatrema bivittatum]|uniref:interferon regulatory factor 8 isoform X2 n=1 Tax=Rhinatrema bivittatum TaxID=194408 RepID=UPI001128BB37|nr:interferon regulatory factor 8 isoform X2 [Rhinatrema bivittatum]
MAVQKTQQGSRMCDRNGGRRLKQWLVEQIDSGMYPGLIWENDDKGLFRIPWKHAGKQDYNQEVDASIFKAWAVFKGKFKEGDKAEPATWKTRLRCALNKSPDFEEVTDRSQLDISEPYKVYRIVPDEEQKCKIGMANSSSLSEDMDCSQSEIDDLTPADEYLTIIKRSPSPVQETCRNHPAQDWWVQPPNVGAVSTVDGYSVYEPSYPGFSQMLIRFYYGGKLVGHVTTSHPDGCRITVNQLPMGGSESMESVCFPSADCIQNERQRQVTRKLFGHLERGVLVHSNRQGVFIKRLCQGRVFWSGNCTSHRARPTKLERDEVLKIFDTNHFLREFQHYYSNQGRLPESSITLCFGEEFPDQTPLRFKLIIVQIEQLGIRQLLEDPGKVYNASLLLPEEAPNEQLSHILQDICGTHQRSFFRENQQITAL